MKRIVVTVSHSELHKHEGQWTYCIPMTDAYCKLQNIPFQHVVLKTNPEDRHFSWAKIPILHKFIDTFDEVLFISENATIINQKSNIFDYIKSAPEEKKWIRDPTVKPILYTLSDKSAQGNPLTGIFLLDCTDKKAAKELLNNWWNDVKDIVYTKLYPYEQHTLINWKSDSKKSSQIRVADVWSVQEYDEDQVFIQITSAYKNIQTYEAKKFMFRILNNKHKKVGIFVRQSNYYSSGAGQNCIFIQQSLEAAGYYVDLLVDYTPSKPSMVDSQIPYIYKSTKNIDYSQYCFILYGSYIPSTETTNKIRELGIRTAILHPMTSFDAVHADHFIHDKKTSFPLFEETFHTFTDEVWLTSNHEQTYKSLLEIQNKYKIPVRAIPLSWAPLFTLFNNVQYTYKNKDSNVIDIIIMEPNVSFVKNAWMPLVIAEAFYMKNKSKLNKVYLFGTLSDEANKMIDRLSIAKDSKLRKIGRMPINEILKFFCHTEPNNKVAVISHNIQCPLNYAYYDVMNAGIPFMHNSYILESQKMGYMYSNVHEGVQQLEAICTVHNSEVYNKRIQDELVAINPYNKDVVHLFENLIEAKHSVYTTIVSTQNEERLSYMKQQLKDIQFPYKYKIFNAYTPENISSEYFNCNISQAGNFSSEKQKMYQCGVRSHIAAMNTCLHESTSDYFLIMEDDIAFNTSINIEKEINRYLQILKKHPEIHYLSLSYRPIFSNDGNLIHTRLHEVTNDEDVYWGFENKSSLIFWGAQAYLIPRYYALKFVNMFNKATLSQLEDSVSTNYNIVPIHYSYKLPQLIIDSIMPIFLNQGIVYPMIAVERYFEHAISISNNIDELTKKYINNVNIPYYKINSKKVISDDVKTCIVSTLNEERVGFLKKQLADIKFPFEYTFFKSFKPSESKEYFDIDRYEPELLLCCMRSHIAAMHYCLQSYTSDYFMIIEDDVIFQTIINIQNKVNDIITRLKNHPEIDYISLSYIPAYLDGSPIVSKLNELKRDNDIYWGFDNVNVDFTIWGSQAYLVSRKCAEKLVSLFHHDKISTIASKYKDYLSTNKKYANKTEQITIDAVMPYIMNQAILYPMLCVEKQFDDSISSTNMRVKQWNDYCESVPCKYYIPAPAHA
jgi:GR25 family glycosyltransferase involved in LPS biosynthesis